jgi:hypothetical protein
VREAICCLIRSGALGDGFWERLGIDPKEGRRCLEGICGHSAANLERGMRLR